MWTCKSLSRFQSGTSLFSPLELSLLALTTVLECDPIQGDARALQALDRLSLTPLAFNSSCVSFAELAGSTAASRSPLLQTSSRSERLRVGQAGPKSSSRQRLPVARSRLPTPWLRDSRSFSCSSSPTVPSARSCVARPRLSRVPAAEGALCSEALCSRTFRRRLLRRARYACRSPRCCATNLSRSATGCCSAASAGCTAPSPRYCLRSSATAVSVTCHGLP